MAELIPLRKLRAKKVDIYVRRKVVVSRHLQGKRPVDTTTSAMRNIGTGGSNA